MIYHAFSICFTLLALALLCLTTTRQPARWSYAPGLILLGVMALFLHLTTPPEPVAIYRTHPPILGVRAGLKLGLWTQSLLPPPRPKHPQHTWLRQTVDGHPVTARPIVLFRQPQAASFRRAGVNYSFAHRFGWCCILDTPTEPQAIIVHSTEGENEAHAFAIFDRNQSDQYLGGIWTHFSVSPEGEIFQYGPLNRISKGQAGLDDIGVGIEIVGHASLWEGDTQTKVGSIITRYQQGNTAQLNAVLALIKTLQAHYEIPTERIYSHEELGHIRDLYGQHPNYQWLREHIRDGVYLNKVPTVDENGAPRTWYDFLEPYDRQDPGRDVMGILRQRL